MGLRREETRTLESPVCNAGGEVGAELVRDVSGRWESGGAVGGAKDAMYARESRLEGEERRMDRINSWLSACWPEDAPRRARCVGTLLPFSRTKSGTKAKGT